MVPVEPAPGDFLADVERARAGGRRGDLRLFAFECRSHRWAAAGLRAVLAAQRSLGAEEGLRETRDWLAAMAPASGDPRDESGAPGPPAAPGPFRRTILFTGHMVDAPGRREPRFPPTTHAEDEARRQIRAALAAEQAGERGPILGIAGGASGGDILFHEIAQELGIPTELLLALPPGQFSARSVQHAGADWTGRFERLLARLPTRILADTADLPDWVRTGGYDIWQRNNLWILFNALSAGAPRLTLIALWDAGRGDGPGGTGDLVAQVESRGHKVVRLPAERLRTLA